MYRISFHDLMHPLIGEVTQLDPLFFSPVIICIINPPEKVLQTEISLFNLDLTRFYL